MTSKQRVFSNSYTTDYIEYIKNKQGIENLKAIKYNPRNKLINKFISYEQFIILSKSYYKYKNVDNCVLYPTKNLYNSNISYINKNINNHRDDTFLVEKNKTQNYHCGCSNKHKPPIVETNNDNNDNNDKCKLLNPVLYPYGKYDSNKISNLCFPYKLNLDKWCSIKKPCPFPFDFDYNNNDIIIEQPKKCKTGLCGNPKPLFI